MTYKLKFLPAALKEWRKLAPQIQTQFKKKLAERLENPHVPASKLRGYDCVYKIKLRTSGYRLAYEVIDDEVVVYVLAIGKRDKDAVYKKLASRID
ncbi:MAG: type II toxin-antitoxin system RelE/ParE family toxin [Gammaproteobacteria bacterium]|jgi:mRNA interferase RelE/StbE|uniref:type II toxin-antitoxin system RelE family toxin n=1 Tax=unclassified Marinomonas TaxID=196814 RepID=UPI000C1DD190|nr:MULTISPECIES: type II toxin-antitoxin system RelE/ParE family toxin [unclassified Marinomonas]MBU1294764.1 type II toxin-antitoxin system RelE/ParE family toxin [Gammaproteobacteria bacterium]MBU1467522.1 type II toxin-antitoxin system RelE/ParE family toxin [Gammaproteobacteria bacterium]MBU2022433.1 type II toxin-antitoxin system RelE/ParE family toxin [Gammaproteobacteria bacterium]MBU2238589.1 type II toxin-antitoxin system RelE/ParE family toxin [Gammaproteobacteria bacterium]MBU231881